MRRIRRWFKVRFILPIKYWRTRRHIIKNGRLRSLDEVFKLKWELENDLLIAERTKNDNAIVVIQAKLDLINYFTYVTTSNQSYYKGDPGNMERY